MRQFEIVIENKVGALAEVAEAMSSGNVNIKAISTELRDGIGIIKLITDNEEAAREALKKSGLDFSEYEIVPVKLKDQPGELARLSRSLANIGVDIESVFMISRDSGIAELAFKVDDLHKAKKVFK